MGNRKKTGDQQADPEKNEDEWRARMFAFVIVAGGGLLVAAWRWGFYGHDIEEIGRRMAIMVPIATLYIAAVTFLLTYWRGLITTRQANQQRDQLKAITDQVRLTEENNLATLLQKGAELLSDKENPSNRSAGIATLRTVASNNNNAGQAAVDLLAEFVSDNSSFGHEHRHVSAAIDAINFADAVNGGFSMRRFFCLADKIPDFDKPIPKKMTRWRPMKAVKAVVYVGGYAGDELVNAWPQGIREPNFQLRRTMVIGVDGIHIRGTQYSHCGFRHCTIASVHVGALADSYFERCDFSGTRIYGGPLPDTKHLRGNLNYCRDTPPFLERNGERAYLDDFVSSITDDQYFAGWAVEGFPAEQGGTGSGQADGG